ncbi:lysophospholipase L1-like esterase [Crossiella equi]|uniref:Lysophospholipase L1-like esterase n=2 Tax=Crossiella equi TaxID=130796 RepID=A0ABS5AA16_9PSEU|nr:lysophospholipase L1-like esterase [Crossiella equi]
MAAMFAVGAVTAAPAVAAPAATNYVALGDSYHTGVGTRNYDPASGDCRRSPQAYAALYAKAKGANFTFAACSGARTADVINSQSNALNASTNLVTVGIGGNDAGFADILTKCQLGSDSECRTAVDGAIAFAQRDLPARLDNVYRTIKSKAPNARVIVVGYPRLFDPNAGLCGMSKPKRTALNQAADILSDVTAARASAAGAVYADVRSQFARNGNCASPEWVNGLSLPVVESYHPNARGNAEGYLPVLNRVAG